jgi:hypothetical protein
MILKAIYKLIGVTGLYSRAIDGIIKRMKI